MPFPQQQPRPYTWADVESLNAGLKGVYGLLQQTPQGPAWIYVGRADDLRARLLQHLGGDNACIARYGPSHWVGALTPDNEVLEKQLTLELGPICNKRVG